MISELFCTRLPLPEQVLREQSTCSCKVRIMASIPACSQDLAATLDHFPEQREELRRSLLRATLQREVRAYSRAMVRLLTGRHSRYARLAGDRQGREAHYYTRLLEVRQLLMLSWSRAK